ncbi:MAG: zeta toxin family protein [Candidatus Nanopelagicaceae bacterium]|nr:zeta toxin family protein [Candidatus Nanopelagicaceae bacterium]
MISTEAKLIVLRGNSGSGKSTTAKMLRDAVTAMGSNKKIAIIEQDYLRRHILKEKETEGADNIELIYQTVYFALKRNYSVILEGILYSKHYDDMLMRLNKHCPDFYYYYFDVTFSETLRRHGLKPNANEFGEAEMREWYKEKDLLDMPGEQLIPETMPQQEIVKMILDKTGL